MAPRASWLSSDTPLLSKQRGCKTDTRGTATWYGASAARFGATPPLHRVPGRQPVRLKRMLSEASDEGAGRAARCERTHTFPHIQGSYSHRYAYRARVLN